MKKLVYIALGVAMIVIVNSCDETPDAGGLLNSITITAQPIGGASVDFLCLQFRDSVWVSTPSTYYQPVPARVQWLQIPGVVLKDTTFYEKAAGTYTEASFLYAKSGSYFNGQYYVVITDKRNVVVTSDTVECTLGRK
jgi:hypothetical protein